MSQIRIGLIGCGAAAHKYYVPVFKTSPELSRSVYCVDKNIDLAKNTASELDTEHFTDDYNSIIEDIDGAIIAVPHFLHFPIAKEIVQNKIPVLCEKPLTEMALQAQELVELAKNNKVEICVNNTRRLFPVFSRVKELIGSGQLGKIKKISYFEANKFAWESQTNFYVDPAVSPKGVLLDLGSHVLDLVSWWLDRKPELVEYCDDSFGGPESFARIIGHLDDTSIEVVLNRLLDLDNHFSIEGEKITVEGSLTNWQEIKLIDSSGKSRLEKIKSEFKSYPEMVQKIVFNFFDVVRGKSVPLIPASEVVKSIEWIEECYTNRRRFNLRWYQNLEALVHG